MKTTYILTSDEYKSIPKSELNNDEYNYRIIDDINQGFNVLKIKLLENGKMPKRGKQGDAGFDIYLPNYVELKAHSTTVIDTGVCVEIAEGYAGMMVVRSSTSKNGIIVQPPLIDSNYRGEMHIIVVNPTDSTYCYSAGERICSLLVFPIFAGEPVRVNKLSESNRGESWSGSSGK